MIGRIRETGGCGEGDGAKGRDGDGDGNTGPQDEIGEWRQKRRDGV